MKKIIVVVLMIFIAILIGCIAGIILWLIWPIVIPNFFPGLVESGVLAKRIDLLPAILSLVLVSLLIKSKTK